VKPDEPPAYSYPETQEGRLLWLLTGTPGPWLPYHSGAPDPYRDGLLKGALAHPPQTTMREKP
jgi:hypothetical protein